LAASRARFSAARLSLSDLWYTQAYKYKHGTVDGGTAQWERKLHDREAGDWFESKVKLSLKANQLLMAT
jgi:hypothetical protein